MVVSDNRKTKNDSALELQHVTTTLILDRMQKVFAIIVLLCCAALMGRANEASQAWVNAFDTNAVERVLLDYTNNDAVLTCPINMNFTTRVLLSEIMRYSLTR